MREEVNLIKNDDHHYNTLHSLSQPLSEIQTHISVKVVVVSRGSNLSGAYNADYDHYQQPSDLESIIEKTLGTSGEECSRRSQKR